VKNLQAEQSNMFAALEHEQKTAHFPVPGDESAQVVFWRGLIARYHAAMMAGDTAAAVAVDAEAELLVDHIHGGRSGCAEVSRRLEAATAAAEGTVPMWGQSGVFTIQFAGVPVRIEIEGLQGLGSFTSLIPHFSIHIVEEHRMFLSSTGYRSFFSHLGEAVQGLSLDAAVRKCIDAYFQGELKGKLVKYLNPDERRVVPVPVDDEQWTGARDPRNDRPNSDEDDEDEDEGGCCCDCGAALAQLDEYFECDEDGGARCPSCYSEHADNCFECAASREPLPVDDLLPGFESVPVDRAAAAAESLGSALTAELLTPAKSITARTGQMEIHSPLFGGSSANPQSSLF
jgi:hypothetical protein